MTTKSKVVAGDTHNGYLERIAAGKYKGYCRLLSGRMDNKLFNTNSPAVAGDKWRLWCEEVRKADRDKAIAHEKAEIEKRKAAENPFIVRKEEPEITPSELEELAKGELVITSNTAEPTIKPVLPEFVYVVEAGGKAVCWAEDYDAAVDVASALELVTRTLMPDAIYEVQEVKRWQV